MIYWPIDGQKFVVGIVVGEKNLLDKKLLTIYLINEDGRPIQIDASCGRFVDNPPTALFKTNSVYSLDPWALDIDTAAREKL